MRDVSNLQHLHYFNTEEWNSLSTAARSGFLEVMEEGASAALLHPTAALLRKYRFVWLDTEVKIYLGPNKLPQLAWIDILGRSSEVQVMEDRYIWFIEGVTDAIDYFE